MIVSTTMLPLLFLATLAVTEALQVYDCEGVNTTYEVVDMLRTEDCPPQTGLYMPAKMSRSYRSNRVRASGAYNAGCICPGSSLPATRSPTT